MKLHKSLLDTYMRYKHNIASASLLAPSEFIKNITDLLSSNGWAYLWFSIVCFMFVPNYCCFLKQAVMFQFLFFPLTLQVSMVFSSFK